MNIITNIYQQFSLRTSDAIPTNHFKRLDENSSKHPPVSPVDIAVALVLAHVSIIGMA